MRIILLFLSFLTLSNFVIAQTNTNVTYTTNTTDIANPGRGFYKHFETSLNSTNALPAITLTELNNLRIDSNITIILKVYYLGAYKTSAISAAYLTGIQNDFNVVRNAGAKIIVRFAFNNATQTHRHGNDASLAQILSHINQLKGVLSTNADVILTVQSGFVGTWGEWYYTHPDFTVTSPAGTPNYANRKQVSDSLLKILPTNKSIQIRTAFLKYNAAMYGNGNSGAANALTSAEAYNGSFKSRAGHHNDCFLAAADDWGTYVSTPMSLDKDYIEQDTKYIINGGETCNDDATYTNCTNAQSELAKMHFSYLNISYNATVLNRWRANGCFNTVKRKLGYRFELNNGTYTSTASVAHNFMIQFSLTNTGYAPIYERNKVQFILKNTSTGTKYTIDVDSVDVRKWMPGSNYSFSKNFGIGTIPNGTYNLLMVVKDSAAGITSNIKYNIRFANTSTWDAVEGANILRSNITVNNGVNPGSGLYSGTEWFGVMNTLSTNLIQFTAINDNNFGLLKWEMSVPNTLKIFSIEKSFNGSIFKELATINNTYNSNFSFKETLELQNSITYYRLKFIEADGTVTYSTIKRVLKNNTKAQVINTYPQPAKTNCTIELLSNEKANTALIISDVNGKTVIHQPIQINVGYNVIKNIDINKLQTGLYIGKIYINGTVLVTKIIKQ